MHSSGKWDAPMALTAGVVLAVMIDWNSLLAWHSSPLFASWGAHGVGTVASLLLVALPSVRTAAAARKDGRSPLWSYLGGVPGAFTVLLAATTVNGPLGLAGTLAFMLVGQMIFGVVVDEWGLFGLKRRRIVRPSRSPCHCPGDARWRRRHPVAGVRAWSLRSCSRC